MKKSYKKGFSLVELLVAMAIIAVLIAIAAYGIQIVQRNARNTKRRKIVQDLQLTIADIQTNHFEYPSVMNVVTGNTIEFTDGATVLGEYEVKGFTTVEDDAACPAESDDPLGVNNEEADQSTVSLCYNGTNLVVGVELEGNDNGFVSDV